MIESNVIEWLDFGDSAQNIDVYSKTKLLRLFHFCRALIKNKNFPASIYAIFIALFFLQLWTMTAISVPYEGDLILEIIDYLKKVILFFEIITNKSNYITVFSITFSFIFVNSILMTIVLFTNGIYNVSLIAKNINYLTSVIYYYFVGPVIIITLDSTLCKNGTHKYLQCPCFTNSVHLAIMILSFIMLILYLFTSFLNSIFSDVIDIIRADCKDISFRINCNYELYCFIIKLAFFIFGFFAKIFGKNIIFKIIFEAFIFINCLIMSIYAYKRVYYYNKIINFLNLFGWYTSTIFTFCIFLKTLLNIKHITYYIIFGLIITVISLYKAYIIEEYLLITEKNIFEFKDIKSVEMYKNILLNTLKRKYNHKSTVIILGIIKKFQEFAKNNPEINFQYNKLINTKSFSNKIKNQNDIFILSIIYILYTYYSEKFVIKEEIILHMCYFLINQFNNPTYSMLLCSKLKTETFKMIYYKYLLAQDIKEHLLLKLRKTGDKESIKHVQIGSVILYYLYADFLKMKIYDAVSNQIDYFDLLKNSVTTNKTMENFLKYGENILKFRKEIIKIWGKMVELNPFSDEFYKDYLLYLDAIIQDEFLSREESKKYILKKNKKYQEKLNVYHSMFLIDTSTVLLTDGYLSNGKILYATRNFPLLFMYSGKELLSLNIEDLLPVVVQPFHKELIENSLKFTNVNNTFKHPKDSMLRNKNGGLFNIKLYVKPAPNLYYGLVYYSYLQKNHDLNLIFTLDKELKITGFTDMIQTGSSFTMNNVFNLTHNILGYHIGLIIPDILSLLEFRNGEYNIAKIDYELKGYLYSIEKTRELKNKLIAILEKIKHSNALFSDYQAQIEDDPQNIINDFNDFIKELNLQNNKAFSIYYVIRKFTFLDGKYKYYRVYVNNNIITEKEYGISLEKKKDGNDNLSDTNKNNFLDFKSNLSRISKESKRKIKLLNIFENKLTKGVIQKSNNQDNAQLTNNSKNLNIQNIKAAENPSHANKFFIIT
jgi:hypothetical protein